MKSVTNKVVSVSHLNNSQRFATAIAVQIQVTARFNVHRLHLGTLAAPTVKVQRITAMRVGTMRVITTPFVENFSRQYRHALSSNDLHHSVHLGSSQFSSIISNTDTFLR
jgi:hypothetical protein